MRLLIIYLMEGKRRGVSCCAKREKKLCALNITSNPYHSVQPGANNWKA